MSTSPASSNETNMVSETTIILNINMTNVTKLTASNFLMWSRQVLAMIDDYDRVGFVDGTLIVPNLTNNRDGVQTPNLAYAIWRRQDRLI